MRHLTIRRRGTRPSLAILIGTNLLMGAIGLVTSRLALDVLGASGRGDLAALQNIPLFLAVVAGLGAGDAALYYSARTPALIRPIVTRASRIAASSGAAVTAATCLILPFALEQPTATRAVAFAPIILAIALYSVLHQPLRAIGQLGLWALFRAAPAVGWLAILLVAKLTNRDNPGILAFLFLMVHVILVAVGWGVRSLLPSPATDRDADLPTTKQMLRYGIPSGLVNVPQVLNLRMDQILMTWAVTRRDLGLYATAAGWSTIGLPVFAGLGQLLMPRLAALNDRTEQMRLARRGTAATIAAAIVISTIGVALTGWLFPLLMGNEARPATNIARILLVAGAISGVQLVLGEIHRGLGNPRLTLFAELIGLASTILTLAILLPHFQLVGAAAASVISYSVVVAVLGGALLMRR